MEEVSESVDSVLAGLSAKGGLTEVLCYLQELARAQGGGSPSGQGSQVSNHHKYRERKKTTLIKLIGLKISLGEGSSQQSSRFCEASNTASVLSAMSITKHII